MTDARILALAKKVAEYSLYLAPGEKVLIDAWDGAEDLAVAIVKEAYRAGAIPLVNYQTGATMRALIMGATEEGMRLWYECELARMKQMDAYVVIRKQDNISEFSDIPPDRMEIYNKYYGMLQYGERAPNTKWCVMRYPTPNMAQLADMSTEGFEDFYFNTCCLNYQKLNELAGSLRARFHVADQIRITGPDTDITFSIKGLCKPISTCGKWNLPCGETGMPVVPDSANGTIRYNIPTMYQGFIFRDIFLRLEKGVIVEATCNNTPLLNRILDIHPNARRIGEFALGYNPYVVKPILDTLFDEKMQMSLHFTPGNSPVNPCPIHWDIVTSHAKEHGGGEIWVDGELIRKDGLFVVEDLLPLNPEPLLKAIAPKDN